MPHPSCWRRVRPRRLFCLVYWCSRMRHWFLVTALLLLVTGAPAAVESGSQVFTITRAEQKTRGRVVYWVVNTPLYREDSYFEVEVRAGDVILLAEYEPRHASETLPSDWKPGVLVQGRVVRRYLYLKRPNGMDLKFVIVKRRHAPTQR